MKNDKKNTKQTHTPVQNEKKKQTPVTPFVQREQPKILKLIFWILAAAIFVAMPLMSLNSGISGDEFVNYEHAGYVYDYYANGDTTCMHGVKKANGEPTHLEYYGQSFDNLTYCINRWFNCDNPFEVRHVLNSLTGACLILVIGLFLVRSCGYRAGILGLLLMFLSPRLIGHSFNNPKDVPFALGYAFTVYQIMLLVQELPKTSIKRLVFIALGIALANSVRIGGLILIPYLFLFCGCWYFFSNPEKKNWSGGDYWKKACILAGKLLLVSLAGYFISLLYWPFAMKDPIHHPIESLKMMEHFATNLRQIFEGGNIMSTDAPWYYLPKYMLMSIPVAVLVGLAAFFLLIKRLWKRVDPQVLFIAFFSFFFPVFYIIYKHSNVYGGWRHVLFTYPLLVAAAGMGWEGIYDLMKNKISRIIAYVVTGLLLLLPLIHIIKNHPHEYVYYNEFAGCLNKCYGYYETDYYQHSTRAATLWLDKYLKENHKVKEGQKLIIASNDNNAITYYLRHDTDRYYTTRYLRYYERSNKDWDYAIIVNSYICAYQLQQGYWPPQNTIHTITVDGKPICAILERKDKSDFEAYELTQQLNSPDATGEERMSAVQQAIAKYRQYLQNDPNNESAIIGIMGLYQAVGKTDSALWFADRLVQVCPSENFLNSASNVYMNAMQQTRNQELLNRVFDLKRQIITSNPRSAENYYQLAMLYAQIGNPHEGRVIMDKCLEKNGGSFTAHYYSAIYMAQTGNPQGARELIEKSRKKFPAHKEECDNLLQQMEGRR